MTTDTDTVTTAPLDEVASWVELYQALTEQAADLDERRKAARERIEAALGEAETGTVDGVPRIRWAHVVSTRLDQAKAKKVLEVYGVLEQCQTTTSSRRFVLVDVEDQA